MVEFKKKILFAAWACKNKKWHTYQLFDKGLRRLFSEVVVFDPKEEYDSLGKEQMNQKFLEVVKTERPDYIFFWFMRDEFYPETLIELKKLFPNTTTFCYNGDDDYKFYNYTLHFFSVIDYFLTTQPDYLKIFKKYGKEPLFACGADTEEFKPLNIAKKYDVSFVGTPKNDRVEFMRILLKENINFAVCGAGWEAYPEFKKNHLGEIDHNQFIKLINESKINICLSKNYFGGTHILERFFEINACKSFCLTEYASGYFPVFKEGYDIATFKNQQELIEKIKYYLKDEKEREAIAKRAYLKTIKSFDNINLIKNAIKFMEKDKKNHASSTLENLKGKSITLSFNELKKGKTFLGDFLKEYDFVSFSRKGYKFMPYKDYFQRFALNKTGKDLCCCDNILSSRLIGDYASMWLYYAFDMKDKSFFYNHLDISQLMVKKEFLLNNLNNFIEMYKGKPAEFINKENTSFISIPFVRCYRKKKIPLKETEHRFTLMFEDNFMVLKNKKIPINVYTFKFLFYSIFFNPIILKLFLSKTLRRTKNSGMVKLASFFQRLFKL